MISSVSLLRSCAIVVSKTITKSVISKSVSASITNIETRQFLLNYSTMRPHIFLTRSDFPTAGIDLLQNEYGFFSPNFHPF